MSGDYRPSRSDRREVRTQGQYFVGGANGGGCSTNVLYRSPRAESDGRESKEARSIGL